MQRKIVCVILMLCAALRLNAQESYETRVRKYIEQYKDWAIAEQKRSGVPAAITLAQGIHETSAGGSELALNANNHFGIKCKKEWNGETYTYTDDAPDECFRKYVSALQSYKDHSDYLAGSKRYAALFNLQPNDYKGWAVGLKRCGYATNPKYSQILIRLVEQYNLQEYTIAGLSKDYNPVKAADQTTPVRPSLGGEMIPEQDAKPLAAPATGVDRFAYTPASHKKGSLSVSYEASARPEIKTNNTGEEAEQLAEDPDKVEYGKLVKINGIRAFYAKKGTVLLEDAFRFKMRYAKLLELNELPDLPLEADMYIYLDKKNPKGIHQTHIVKPGETLVQIAQAEAMQLRYLKYYNRVTANEEPEEGTTLQLQQYSENKPATYVKNAAPHQEQPKAFAGSRPRAIPQGTTRTRASYITKKEINAAQTGNAASGNEDAEDDKGQTKGDLIASMPQSDRKEPEVVENTPVLEKIAEPLPVSVTIPQGGIGSPKAENVKKMEQANTEPVAQIIQTDQAKAYKDIPAEKDTVTINAVVVEGETIPVAESTPATEPSIIKKQTAEEDSITPAVLLKNETPKREEIEYETVQPAPVVVEKTTPSTIENIQQGNTIHQAEAINPIIPAKATTPTVKTEKVSAAPAKVNVPLIEEEPKDEYARLKAKLDKVVYITNTPAQQPAAEQKKEDAKKDSISKEVTGSAKPADGSSKMYTVKKGDTAFGIAKKNNITMRQLMEWNKLDFKEVKAGQQLRVKP